MKHQMVLTEDEREIIDIALLELIETYKCDIRAFPWMEAARKAEMERVRKLREDKFRIQTRV